MNRGSLEADRVDRVHGVISLGGRRTANKPSFIQFVAVGFGCAGEMPTVVPNFDPRMISAFVRPKWCPHKPSRNANRAACIDQQNRQASARGGTRLDRLVWTLVRLGSLCRIPNTKKREEFLIEAGCREPWRLCAFDQWLKSLTEILPPGIAALIDICIG